ncbi:response regulator [Microbacterium esteraromaticum]|uniref:response regulator n=1 Tax=Microbacterium esteraromaticum TaxID=57043 RepID=UPI0023675405|nr:response regulator [Microbacterium esteraromaticum]WDH79490.1 response regulator [Microbacterium esteraromaticum]
MYMSAETITILIGIVSLLLALAGGFGWMIHCIDRMGTELNGRMDRTGAELNGRMDRMGAELNGRMDRMGAELSGRMDRMSDELVEVKIAIARVEGPQRHLLTGR